MKLQRVHSWLPGIILAFFLAPAAALAEDAYVRVRLDALKVTEGQIPKPAYSFSYWRIAEARGPQLRLDDGAEGYCVDEATFHGYDGGSPSGTRADRREIVVRARAGAELSGTLYLPDDNRASLVKVRFTIAGNLADPKAREEFLRAKARHYDALVARRLPGGAWFRQQADAAREALGEAAAAQGNDDRRPSRDVMEDTFGLLTGGRALFENLQLDRAMRAMPAEGETMVDLASIKGITVREMDWRALVKDKHPALDPLATIIPADQHAVFFPSFEAFVAVADQADNAGTPIVQLLEPRSEDAGAKARYQRQMCLSLTGLGRVLGPQMVNSVAVTGSDPYLRVGSDVAIILEAKDPAALRKLLTLQIAMARQLNPAATSVSGRAGGIEYTGAASPDRSISAYLMALGDAVVVSNSPAQLERLAAVFQKHEASLASTPEYTFFRDRYKRGEAGESALVVLSDATIRRWCGPRWRIADSRRTRAGAVMSGIAARHMDAFANNAVTAGPIDARRPDLGEVSIAPGGVRSSVYGALDFMTPIAELEMDKVSTAEAQSYQRWRDGYQQNWSQFFDPIAVRLAVSDKRLAADLTVMPLIAGTAYAPWIETSRGVKLSDAFSDSHESLLRWSLAIDKDSRPIKQMAAFAQENVLRRGLDLTGWLGKSFSIYVEDDPYWEQMRKAADPEKFVSEHVPGLPVAVSIDVSDPPKLAAFMVALRMYVDGTVPGMTKWEPVPYRGHSYMRIVLTESGRAMMGPAAPPLAIYYAALPEQLVLSLNESAIKRALDRHLTRVAAAAAAPDAKKLAPAVAESASARPLLGQSAILQVDRRFADAAAGYLASQYRPQFQLRAWGNIPILNEWRRLYPNEDPVKLHQRVWHAKLLCPGGGEYVWNEQWQTMESTVYGHPGQPKPGPTLPPAIRDFSFANFGIDFEENGLRARAELDRKKD